MQGKTIVTSSRVYIQGLKNIFPEETLSIGLSYYGFMCQKDQTLFNVKGKLTFKGHFSIAKGCRFDVGQEAVVEFGSGYMSPDTHIIIMHGLTVGDDCAISWGCQFLDDDFHKLEYEGRKKPQSSEIKVGSLVV